MQPPPDWPGRNGSALPVLRLTQAAADALCDGAVCDDLDRETYRHILRAVAAFNHGSPDQVGAELKALLTLWTFAEGRGAAAMGLSYAEVNALVMPPASLRR